MPTEEQADIRRTIERLYDEKDELRRNQCLICEHPADHDQRLCVARLERAEAERDEAYAQRDDNWRRLCEANTERDRLESERDDWRAGYHRFREKVVKLRKELEGADQEALRLDAEISRLREELVKAYARIDELGVLAAPALNEQVCDKDGQPFSSGPHIKHGKPVAHPPNEQPRRHTGETWREFNERAARDFDQVRENDHA